MAQFIWTSSAALLLLYASAPAAAGEGELETAVVSATRLRSFSDLDVPASITNVTVNADSNDTQTNVTEVLGGIPGVTALDRQNYAQDTQLSIRGFGARATFGVRGLRLYADGIPASMPDGQGQLSHFNLVGAERVQVMRGPFSSLHGNSSGGVVQIWSQPGTEELSGRVRAAIGSFDERTYGAQFRGTTGPLDFNLAGSRFQTDGYRDHAAARRDSANLRVGVDTGEGRELTLVMNYLDIPEAQDPLGVTPESWRADPRQTLSQATQFNTRKSVDQLQGGVVFEQKVGTAQTLHAMAYAGNRKVVQYLPIAQATQNPATHSGGVVDLDTDYRGGDLRWSWQGDLAGRPLEITAGGNFDLQVQLRRGYNNYDGTTLGVRGTLRRNETNRVHNFDQFAQGMWQFAERWSVLAGLRHSEVKFRSTDRYLANGEDSDTTKYGDTTLVAGLMFRPLQTLRLYASVGDGFETPTFNELAYRSDAQSGMALYLRPASSHEYEIGAKWRPANAMEVDVAAFRADTSNDLAIDRNAGGRSAYRNIDSRRQGLEAGLRAPFSDAWEFTANYTYLDATFTESFNTCGPPPCTTPTVPVAAGTRMPGVARHQGQMRLQWTPGAWVAALEFNATGNFTANDSGTEAAPGYGVWSAELGHNWSFDSSSLRAYVRAENLLDHDYVGTVIVNEANRRYFEAAPDRTATVGIQWSWN